MIAKKRMLLLRVCYGGRSKLRQLSKGNLFGYKMQTDYDFMMMALAEAELAYSKEEVPVGAILVNQGSVLARAHNSPITRNDPSAHAEMLVLRQAAEITGNYRLAGAELYVTLEPCIMCAGAMVHARLARVIFGTRDPKSGAVASLYKILTDERLNHQVIVTEGILKEECGEILSRFFREKRVIAASAT
jgi:tRNA(adenine34) deaminase